MKKFTILMAAIALVCFSVPALAVDWNFYGSPRMATFYTSTDEEDVGPKSTDTQWDLNGNSRFGANVKADHIKGQFEFGVNEDTITSRRLYGVWNFGAGTLKVGKDYTPITQFISAQVFDTDLGLLEFGAPYGGRHGQIALGFGGFEVAFINPTTELISGLEGDDTVVEAAADPADPDFTLPDGTPLDVTLGTSDNGSVQRIIPKIEASWGMAFDAFNFKIMGGYQYYSIKDVVSSENGSTDDVTVTSYTIAGGGTFNFGPAYVGAQAQWGQNAGTAGWGMSYNGYDEATWDGDDKTDDVDSYGGILVAGMKVSDMLSFELGGGYMVNDPKDAPKGFDEKTKSYSVYLNSTIALAPGVFIVPEVGMLAFGNNPEDQDEGSLFYLGAKWQINF